MNICLAANYSPQLVDCLRENPELVDGVKVSEFYRPAYIEMYRRLGKSKRLILHGICQNYDRYIPPGNSGFIESLDLEGISCAIRLTQPEYISLHLECRVMENHENGGSKETENHQYRPDEFLKCLKRDVEAVRQLTGLPVHLENGVSRKPGTARSSSGHRNAWFTTDPGFITEALHETGCRFLLDIAHAQIMAGIRGVSAEEYLNILPLDLVHEVHINGPALVNGVLKDRHEETTEEGYALLEMLLANHDIRVVSLEYGGVGPLFESRSEIPALMRQLARMRSIIGS